MIRPTILCDVDGVVADLMGGFARWMEGAGLPAVYPDQITLFDIRRCAREPHLAELDDYLRQDGFWPKEGGDGGINGAFMSFMQSDAYDWVHPIPGAIEGIADLQTDHDIYFLTALMKAAPEHVPSKMHWLARYFPGIKYFTAPSELKQMVRGIGTIMIDDRHDTCQRFIDSGAKSFLYRQPWNEAPEGAKSYDWNTLAGAIRGRYQAA